MTRRRSLPGTLIEAEPPSPVRRLKRPACVAIFGLLLTTSVASASSTEGNRSSARVVFRNWVERTSHDYGNQPMTFRIRSVTVDRRGWWVRADIVNRSRQTITIGRGDRRNYRFNDHFALQEPGPPCDPSPTERCLPTERPATRFKPFAFRPLRPGQAWRGSFGGYGRLQRRVPIYIALGVFIPQRGNRFSWMTQRAFRLP